MSLVFLSRLWLAKYVMVMAGTCLTTSVASAGATFCPPHFPHPSREVMLKAQQHAADRGFLWRISSDGRDSYLYGTIHAGRPDWFALGPKLDASLFRSGLLVLEINVTDPTVLTELRGVSSGAPRPLPADLMQSLRKAWAAECLPAADLDLGAAEYLATQLAVAQARRVGLFPAYGAESVLLMRSLRVERPVVGLESVRTQLSALLAAPMRKPRRWCARCWPSCSVPGLRAA